MGSDARRPPPDRDAGPSRDLSGRAERFVERTAATDRRERYERRRLQVAEVRRGRRRRRLTVAAVTAASSAVALIVAGSLVGGTTGALIGAGAAAVVALGVLTVRWLAARRGATAWDWQLQRHRLMANPSERVRASDDPQRRSDDDRSRFWQV